jgi:cytochrome c-type biogenesis protein CcmH/NrfG
MHMDNRANKIISVALIALAVAVVLPSLRPHGLYQRVSHLLLTTASMEAAANGGAIGEDLQAP